MDNYYSTKVSKRKKYIVRIAAALLLFSFGILSGLAGKAQDSNNNSQSNFFAVTGNGLKDTSWLFGTYHLVRSSYLEEVPAVMNAFMRSKGVVVELVLDSARLSIAGAIGMLKDKTLTDLLHDPFKDSLEKEVMATLGIRLSQINRLKPVNVALTLSMVYLVTDKNSPLHKYSGSPIDGYFAETGRRAGKKITEFETIEEQMDLLFNKTADEEQVNMLKTFLRNKSEMISQGNELIGNWFRHDLDKMYAVSEKGLAAFGSEADLLKKRNDKWMSILPGLLAKEPQFVAVGALHLAGPDGLVKQLRQLGYTVTAVKL